MKVVVTLLVVVVVGLGVGCGGDSGDGTPSVLVGYWECTLADGDFDGVQDEMPGYYLFLDITAVAGGTVSGHLHRQAGAARSDAPLTGSVSDAEFHLSAELDGEVLSFDGSLDSAVNDLAGAHLVADWSSSAGPTETVVLVPVTSHIDPAASATAAYRSAAKLGDVTSELARLEQYKGTGQLVILVHGLLSSPQVWDPMLKQLEADGYLASHEFWRFSYDTRQPFELLGPELKDLVDKAGLVGRQPILLAHSMGGLVSRSYIALGGGHKNLVTLGTPHLGTSEGVFGVIVGAGTIEMSPCTPELVGLYESEAATEPFPPYLGYAVASGDITGSWQMVMVNKCLPACPPIGPCCAEAPVPLFRFDRDYDTKLKAGWTYIHASGLGENDGAVPTASENFCVGPSDHFPCSICPPIDFERDKHLSNYDHFMLVEPDIAPDVYEFVKTHL